MKRVFSKVTAVIVAIAVVLSTMGTIDWLSINSATNVLAAATTITSMECYNSANGPVIKREGVDEEVLDLSCQSLMEKQVKNSLFQM